MHEYSLVQALLKRVAEEASQRHATAVHRVAVRIGPLAGVERALFATAFDVLSAGTVADGAALQIETERLGWRCTSCDAAIPEGEVLACPACGWPVRLTGGDALTLERIELEVPQDVPGLRMR
ncbi:MAG: hydrogenase maturation nickel metallochaperone HypA [bacterium]